MKSLDNNWNKENHQSTSSACMKNSWKLDAKNRKMHTKIKKIYLSRSKNVQKGFTSLT